MPWHELRRAGTPAPAIMAFRLAARQARAMLDPSQHAAFDVAEQAAIQHLRDGGPGCAVRIFIPDQGDAQTYVRRQLRRLHEGFRILPGETLGVENNPAALATALQMMSVIIVTVAADGTEVGLFRS